jgi:hypothetical protein
MTTFSSAQSGRATLLSVGDRFALRENAMSVGGLAPSMPATDKYELVIILKIAETAILRPTNPPKCDADHFARNSLRLQSRKVWEGHQHFPEPKTNKNWLVLQGGRHGG